MAIVRPQPQVTITQRSPSPMPMPKGPSEDLRRSKLPLSTTAYRSSSSSSRGESPLNSPTKTTAASLTKYRPRTADGSHKPPLGLRRSATASNALSGVSSLSSSPRSTSMSRSIDGPGLMQSRSLSSIRRPYSLMKVQSTSSVDRKPGRLSIRVTSQS